MTDTDREPRLWTLLTPNSTKAEVLAAVEQSESITREVRERIERGDTEGIISCRASDDDGNNTGFGRTEEGDVLDGLAFHRHMAVVGEEDQSVPGWDFGA